MRIDQPRFAEWVRLSHRLGPLEAFMITTVQGLGRLDAQLIAEDREFISARAANQIETEPSFALTDRLTYSYLWVLGSYEILRSVDQRCSKSPPPFVNAEIAAAVRATKYQFERVRVPLAKFEAARKFAKSDGTVAFPAIHAEHGISWRVSQDTYIARESLSQAFMETLRLLPPNKSLERTREG
jgi:hypothetical protein